MRKSKFSCDKNKVSKLKKQYDIVKCIGFGIGIKSLIHLLSIVGLWFEIEISCAMTRSPWRKRESGRS